MEEHQIEPLVEKSLWREWVVVVCGWDKIDPPDELEWNILQSNFYTGTAPVESVSLLKNLRGLK